MNIEKLKAGGIDFEDGLERFSGNREMYEKYLRRLLELSLYSEMREAALRGNIQEAFLASHKLKAFIGNLSINSFYEDIRSLTEEFRAGVKRDYHPDFERMDQEYEKILQAIRGNDDVR